MTCVDGALRESGTGSCAAARQSLATLTRLGIPVVLTSNGRMLHIPRGYFGCTSAKLGLGAADEWDALEFTPPSTEDALDALRALCQAGGDSPLLVGVGASWPDHALLRSVDIPILVRSALVDQTQLRNRFPEAYLTVAAGPAGWSEAILGPA